MAKIDGFTKDNNGVSTRMARLQCDTCGFEWAVTEISMLKLENIYSEHKCNNCIAKANKLMPSKWKA
jgi:hypothetical protein